MSNKKKYEPIEKESVTNEIKEVKPEENIEAEAPKVEIEEPKVKNKKSTKSINANTNTNEPKFKIGDIVFISKDAEADLNGFKLFPQYKKYTYTVEAYDPKSEVYSLRRLNLSLQLKEFDIVAPNERANDSLNRKQF